MYNEAQLLDTPFANPFTESSYIEYYNYMTSDSTVYTDKPGQQSFVKIRLRLTDTMTLRSRTVYSLITLISEMSGFADLLYVSVGFLLGLLYTQRMMEAALLKSMRPIDLSRERSKILEIPKKLGVDDVL
jgi:hypothetical protein